MLDLMKVCCLCCGCNKVVNNVEEVEELFGFRNMGDGMICV